jgi:hypothetical protein
MSENEPKPNGQSPVPPTRPVPPPYSPNKALIGYIEQGQNPPGEIRKRS